MNTLSTGDSVNTAIQGVNYTTLTNKYFDSDEPVSTVAANTNDPVVLTRFTHFVAFFGAWTQNSYDAWGKAGSIKGSL